MSLIDVEGAVDVKEVVEQVVEEDVLLLADVWVASNGIAGMFDCPES